MVGSNCAFNTAAALRRVFMPSHFETLSCLHVTRIFVPALQPPTQHHQARTYAQWWTNQAKPAAGAWASDPLPGLNKKLRSPQAASNPSDSPKPPPPKRNLDRPGPRVKTKLARLPRDDEIRQKFVYVKEVQHDGVERLSEPRTVRGILALLDRKTESLEVQHMPDPDNPDAPKWPIAKIVNRKEELARKQKEKDQKKKAATNKEKELEFNWALAPHDVEHKLRTLKKFLAKGYKVQLLLLRKSKKGAKASRDEAEALLARVVEATAEVPGSKEWKSREGQLLGSMRIFLQGKLQEKEDVAEEVETPK